MKKIDFSVIIVTWNRLNDLKNVINSVIKQEKSSYEIIIVDNGSVDGTTEWIRIINNQKIKHIRLYKNYGTVTARNIGISNSTGEMVFLLDDDAWISDSLLFYKVNKVFKRTNAGAVSINILENNIYREKINYSYYYGFFSGGAVFIKKAVFDIIGYFDDNFFRQSEEFDFCLRMAEKKLYVYFCPDLFINHNLDSKKQKSEEILFYSFRNKSLTIKKNIRGIDNIFFNLRNNFLYFIIFLKLKKINLFFKALNSKRRILKENKNYIKPVSKKTMRNWYYLMKYKPEDKKNNKSELSLVEYIFFKLDKNHDQ
ncbi:MAG: glycosyltransferase [Spirochaetes bacterium]|nr:glycosyltransferase [Spirochaetota bacterium]